MADRDSVENFIHLFELDHHTLVSRRAKQLIKLVLDSIVEDPHPSWNLPGQDLLEKHNDLVRRVPNFLSGVLESEHGERHSAPSMKARITTFELLHWLGGNLDRICPIEKSPRRRER